MAKDRKSKGVKLPICPYDGGSTEEDITQCPFCYFPLIKNINDKVKWPISFCPEDGKGYYDPKLEFCKSSNGRLMPYKSPL